MSESFLRRLRERIGERLVEIEDVVGPEYVLSLVVRHRSNRDAHILLTTDTYEGIRQAIEDLCCRASDVLEPGGRDAK